MDYSVTNYSKRTNDAKPPEMDIALLLLLDTPVPWRLQWPSKARLLLRVVGALSSEGTFG